MNAPQPVDLVTLIGRIRESAEHGLKVLRDDAPGRASFEHVVTLCDRAQSQAIAEVLERSIKLVSR